MREGHIHEHAGEGFVDEPAGPGGLSRRTFLNRAGLLGAGAVLAQIPGFLARQGWLEAASAQSPDMIRDALNGLVAFVVPGPDPYSQAQGESTTEPGGIEAGATQLMIDTLDRFAGSHLGPTLPAAAAVAGLLNEGALQVNPAATRGGFPSPFARLSFDEKIEVFRRLEEQTEGSELRFVAGVLIGLPALLAYGDGPMTDPVTRQLTAEPVGWQLTGYDGIAEGRAELRGYWQGRRRVKTARRYRVRRRRRRT